MANPQTTAKITDHPIHPMLISFPIAFFVAAFACDLAYWRTGHAAFAEAAIWLLGAGVVMGLSAGAAGLTDLLGDQRIRALTGAWWHAGGNVVVILIEAYNWYIRYAGGTAAVVPQGLLLSLAVVGILLYTGWKGWEMVYHYRVGVADEAQAAAPRAQAPPKDTTRRAA